jgi:methylmalonyl-CoA mutase N-terminal domain/subunit
MHQRNKLNGHYVLISAVGHRMLLHNEGANAVYEIPEGLAHGGQYVEMIKRNR